LYIQGTLVKINRFIMQKILLAEDDPNLGDLLKDYLELKGKFDVTLCIDGDEAVSQFKKK